MSQLYFDESAPAAGRPKVCLATPVYDRPDPGYVHALQRSREHLHRAGFETAYMLLSGNCHVDDSRNRIVQEFLLTDCTDLVFLDADVTWQPEQLLKLCRYDCDVVGGIYPYRSEERRGAGGMPVVTIPDVIEPDRHGLLEVAGLPAGFLRIRRHVLETLAEPADQYKARGDRRALIPILFERTFDNGIRWGGDITFCRKWHDLGGKLYAAAELRLGHTARTMVYDSLGAALRRQTKKTLFHLADRLRSASEHPTDFAEAIRFWENESYVAPEEVLVLCAVMGRKAQGPIIEAGSGLSTIVLAAAAANQTVYCLEHDPVWVERLDQACAQAKVGNVFLAHCPLRDGWYDLDAISGELPDRFALGVNDGPPRLLADRRKFFDILGERCDAIIADDADSRPYGDAMESWAEAQGRRIDFIEDRAAVIRLRDRETEHDRVA